MDGGDLGLGQPVGQPVGVGHGRWSRSRAARPAMLSPIRAAALPVGATRAMREVGGVGQQEGEEGGDGGGLARARAADDHREQTVGAGLGGGALLAATPRAADGERGAIEGRSGRRGTDGAGRGRPPAQLGGDRSS